MDDFYNTLISSFNDGLNNHYAGRIVDKDLKMVSSINEIVDEIDLKYYTEFLNDLPKSEYTKVALNIWKYILNQSVEKQMIDKKNTLIKNSRVDIKPSTKIKSDLGIVKKFKSVLERAFHTQSVGTHIKERLVGNNKIHRVGYSSTNTPTDKKLYSIDDLFEIVDLMLHDLETKEFKFIGKNAYFEYDSTRKATFTKWLEDICRHNNISAYNYRIRELTDNLTIQFNIFNKST